MGIYIHGLSLPPKGEAYLVDPDGVVYRYIPTDDGEDHIVRKIDAKPVEVPPHGRLGDLDALRAEHGLGEICENCPVDQRYCQYEMIYTKMEVCGWLDDAPTVIPADGGADNG